MPFTWTSINSLQDKINASHITEARNNLNTVTDALGVGRYSWSTLASSPNDNKFGTTHIQEIRQGVEYSDQQNVCAAYNSANYPGKLTSNDSTINSTQNTGVLSSNDTSVQGAQYSPYQNGVLNGVLYSQCAPNYSGQCNPYYSGRQATVHTAHQTNALSIYASKQGCWLNWAHS